MSKRKRVIKVFIASPGDLWPERIAFKGVVDKLNGDFGDGARVEFEALAWEDTVALVNKRNQALINRMIDECHLFVLVMWRRWGQDYVGDPAYSSYTEEEFYRALHRWEKSQHPKIVVLFKKIDPGQMADPGEQLKHVLAFRKRVETSVLPRAFEDDNGFAPEVEKFLRTFARGELEDLTLEEMEIPIPSGVVDKLAQAEEAAKNEAARAEEEHRAAEAQNARADEFALRLARQAAKAALEGRLEEARQDLALASDDTQDLDILYLAYEFYRRTGDLAEAERMIERWLVISGPHAETANSAAAYGNLGLIYHTRGDLDRAEEMLRKSLEINEKLGRQEGMANQYGNLGVIYQTRGDLDRAEQMLRESLEMCETLGLQEGMAIDYCNLGVIYRRRGDLDRAEEMHRKSLEIAEELGLQEGMATQYANLGLIYRARGDLDRAEEMHGKSLEINEKLGRQEGTASDYSHLGLIYRTRGDLDRARELWTKAHDIYLRMGVKGQAAEVQGWIDNLAEG